MEEYNANMSTSFCDLFLVFIMSQILFIRKESNFYLSKVATTEVWSSCYLLKQTSLINWVNPVLHFDLQYVLDEQDLVSKPKY